MRNLFLYAFVAMATALGAFVTACRPDACADVPDAVPSVYYWRTTLTLDSTERAFLADHRVGKVYLRLFDVVAGDGKCIPSATITFNDILPDTMRVVPVVFLTEDCLRADTAGLAKHIVERAMKMCATHKLPGVKELQIDCDWTPTSRAAYYNLLRQVRSLLSAQGMRLSVTVRLHQLSQPEPPADYGVLMLYNTGDFRNRQSRNPIFATEDIEPYLPHLKAYPLPLCAAYPNFRWQRLFSGNDFKALLYSENLRDSTVYEPMSDDSLYRVVQGRTLHGVLRGAYDVHLSPGDEVLVSRAHPDEVLRLAHKIHQVRPSLHRQVIFYHLDNPSIENYKPDDYETLYRLYEVH